MLLVLWDIDGTLVDAAGHGRRAFDDAFEEVLGRRPHDVELAGRTDHQIALAMLEGAGDHLPRIMDELAGALAAREDALRADGRAYPGAADALAALARHDDVVQSVLTGNIEANAALKLSAFGLERFVDLEVGAYGSDPHATRSDLVAVARERAGARYGDPADVVLVGDTPLDIRAAHEARARAVAVASGPYTTAELTEAGADEVLPDLRDTASVVRAVTRR